MKFKLLILLLFISSIHLQAESYVRVGNTFETTTTSSTSKETPYTYKDGKGNIYPIYITAKGRCFIIKTSQKTGKEYKQYLKEDIARQICLELHINYQEK